MGGGKGSGNSSINELCHYITDYITINISAHIFAIDGWGLLLVMAQCVWRQEADKVCREHSSQGKGLEKRGESLDVLRIITPATVCNYSGFIQSNLNAS